MRWYIRGCPLSLLQNCGLFIFVNFLRNTQFDRPRPFIFSIVDEVDSVLIDEGRNPLLISGEVFLANSFANLVPPMPGLSKCKIFTSFSYPILG